MSALAPTLAVAAPRRALLRSPWAWLLMAMLLGTLPFWLTDLDVRLAALFHGAAAAGGASDLAWPLAQSPTTVWLYRIGSHLAWLMLVFGVVVVLAPQLRHRRDWRQAALLFLTALVLGSGLLVNAIGKDMTGRPRPRQLEQFQGNGQYLAPLQLGTPGKGESFPCGHCSVGFAAGAAGLVLMQSRPLWGGGLIVFSLLLGTGIGVARMAAGAHFASDVIWAAALVWLPTLGIWHVLRRGWLRGRHPPRWIGSTVLAGVPFLVVGGLLAAQPFQQSVQTQAPDGGADYLLDLQAADLRVELAPSTAPALVLSGEVKGYGLPGVQVRLHAIGDDGRWQVRQRIDGWTSEVEAPLILRIRPDALARTEVRIGRGSIGWSADAHARLPGVAEAKGRELIISGPLLARRDAPVASGQP